MVEDKKIMQPFGDRSKVVIEPMLTDQWFVDAEDAGGSRPLRRLRRRHEIRAEELGQDLLQLDAKHPALVHFAPALVGPPDPGLV
jgi:valyl-tRNA synthetase